MKNSQVVTPPYFLPAEIVRAVAKAIDSKNDNAVLDNKCQDLYMSRNELEALAKGCIYNPIKELKFNKVIESGLEVRVNQMFDDYLKTVATYNLSERHRDEIGPWLIEAFFTPHLINIIYFLAKNSKPFQKNHYIELMSYHTNCIETAFQIIERQVKGWDVFYEKLCKNDKDKITSWRRGDHLPSCTSLKTLFNCNNQKSPKKVLLFLIVARAVQYFKINYQSDILDQYINQPRSLEASMKLFNDASLALQNKDMEYVDELYRTKDTQFKHRISIIIIELLTLSLSNFAKGELKEANRRLQQAFDLSLFRAGHMCEKVIELGLVIASWQERPDMVLISKLKSVQNLYGYTLPTIVTEDAKRKKENLVENWEINMWRSNAHKVFDAYKVKLPEKFSVESSMLPINTQDESLELDLKRPEKKIHLSRADKIYKNKNKKKYTATPLIWATLNKDIDAVEQLLEAGANINKLADNNESALLVALQHMNLTEPHEPDDRFYQAFKDLSYDRKTVNAISAKRHLFPLMSAVQTGSYKVVEHILALGANVNLQGGGYHLSSLTECVRLIGIVKNPSLVSNQMNMINGDVRTSIQQMSDSDFANFLRDTQGRFGINKQQVINALDTLVKSSPKLFKEFGKLYSNSKCNNFEKFDLEELRRIAKLLLDHGADPNAAYDINGLKGYTPFLLACESDEAELVEYMLASATDNTKRKQADINIVCQDSKDGKVISCFEVCRYFGSEATLAVLAKYIF